MILLFFDCGFPDTPPEEPAVHLIVSSLGNCFTMIANRKVAAQIEALMRDVSRQLNQSIRLVRESRPDNEFQAYRRAAGFVMGRIFTDIMRPIYKTHPQLVPRGLKMDPDTKQANQRAAVRPRPRSSSKRTVRSRLGRGR